MICLQGDFSDNLYVWKGHKCQPVKISFLRDAEVAALSRHTHYELLRRSENSMMVRLSQNQPGEIPFPVRQDKYRGDVQTSVMGFYSEINISNNIHGN